jgi:HIRAN domain.
MMDTGLLIIVGIVVLFMIRYVVVTARSSAKIPEGLRFFVVTKTHGYVNIYVNDPDYYSHIEFYIAGVQYRKNIDNYLGEFMGNLVPEPRNPHDRNAIKIVAMDGHHVGYVPKNMTAKIRAARTLPCPCYCFIAKHRGQYLTSCWIKTYL